MANEMVKNALSRLVPTEVNGVKAVPFQGVGKFRPTGKKAAPPIATCSDYPDDVVRLEDKYGRL